MTIRSTRSNIWRFTKHYAYGCFATSWNGAITAVHGYIAIAVGSVVDPDHISAPSWSLKDANGQTLDADHLVNVLWPAWVASLPSELVESVAIGGGKSMLRPKWLESVFDCDNHTHSFREYVVRCCAVDAVRKNEPRGGTLLGSLSYQAIPRAGSRRAGGHDVCWFIDHSQHLRWFEPSDGTIFTPQAMEVVSVWEGEQR